MNLFRSIDGVLIAADQTILDLHLVSGGETRPIYYVSPDLCGSLCFT